jgi:6-phosphogluconolactonase (cycloisomerase 2 family)
LIGKEIITKKNHFMTTSIKSICSAVLLLGSLLSCKKEILESPDQDSMVVAGLKAGLNNPRTGFVYTMSNEGSGNSILQFKQAPNGSLSYETTTASGGVGNNAGLGSQGSLVISESHKWLFAVNAGSNSISSFAIQDDGVPMLAYTTSSNGTFPVSVTVSGDLLYVVNSTSSNISGYRVHNDGSMHPIDGSVKMLSSAATGPAQISFTPSGDKLVVTEKATNMITTFPVNAAGVAGTATSTHSAGNTPFGFDFAGAGTIVVTEAWGGMPNASTVSAYSVSGVTSVTGGAIQNKQTAACWATATSDGRYAYVTNTGSNNISSFEISAAGNLTLINATEVTTGTTPIDITLSGNDFYVYNINSNSHSITQFKKGGNASLTSIGSYEGLPLHAVGIAAF